MSDKYTEEDLRRNREIWLSEAQSGVFAALDTYPAGSFERHVLWDMWRSLEYLRGNIGAAT